MNEIEAETSYAFFRRTALKYGNQYKHRTEAKLQVCVCVCVWCMHENHHTLRSLSAYKTSTIRIFNDTQRDNTRKFQNSSEKTGYQRHSFNKREPHIVAITTTLFHSTDLYAMTFGPSSRNARNYSVESCAHFLVHWTARSTPRSFPFVCQMWWLWHCFP